MNRRISRREMVVGAAAVSMAAQPEAAVASAKGEPFRFGLNTSTIHGQKLPLVDEIEIAAKAGYQAIEPWLSEIGDYVKGGGTLPDLAKRLQDHGLAVESAIGFFDWIVDDDARRARAMEQAKHDMDLVARIGGKRIAAPASGATDVTNLDLRHAAERYRALLELGDSMGVIPQVEVWGFSKTLTTLGEAAQVAIGADHPKALILADIYHLYKGGSGFEGLKLLNGSSMHVLHMNDYPANPPRAEINDSHRVYPGDGVAPMDEILRTLHNIGFDGVLSVELFNPDYYKQDALTVAKTALQKSKACVHRALGKK